MSEISKNYRDECLEVMQKASIEGMGYYLDGYVARSSLEALIDGPFKTAILKAYDGLQELNQALADADIYEEDYEY